VGGKDEGERGGRGRKRGEKGSDVEEESERKERRAKRRRVEEKRDPRNSQDVVLRQISMHQPTPLVHDSHDEHQLGVEIRELGDFHSRSVLQSRRGPAKRERENRKAKGVSRVVQRG